LKLYRGFIENNISPKKDGRVQVRIVGIHDPDKSKVKTKHLPWAEILQPLQFGFSSGIGFNSVPNIGTWVFVFLDHDNPNKPIVIGSISGKATTPSNSSLGFNDPTGKFPLVDRLNEEDQNRLQRVQELDKTIHQKINDSLDKVSATDNISGANVSQTEPKSLSNLSKYPDNNVIETKSGHVFEIDDTPGNERIRLYHKSGTYVDYRPDGSISEKIKGDINKIVEGCIYYHIKNGVRDYIEKNLDQIITGGIRKNVKMDNFQHIAGFFKITADGNLEINNDVKITGSTEIMGNLTASGNITSKSEIADSTGNLSSLRNEYNSHEHQYHPGPSPLSSTASHPPDPNNRVSDYTWSSTPLGFAK